MKRQLSSSLSSFNYANINVVITSTIKVLKCYVFKEKTMKRLFLLSITMFTCLLISLTSTSQALVDIISISSNNQTGAAGYPLKKPFWIKLRENGSGVKNHQIKFRVIQGGGRMSIEDATTDGTGKVKSTLILGHEAGINKVEVRAIVNGVSATKFMTATGIRSVTDIFDRTSGSTPNIWRKFIGEDVSGNVPDLIDYSYAGYKNGEEPIPDVIGTIYDVTSYGAIPNDGESDTQAIRDTLRAAENGGVVFFPPGQYDVLTPGESPEKITIGKRWGSGNIVLRGSGAQGHKRNGTTIKMHNYLDSPWSALFKPIWQHDDRDNKTSIVGEFPRGTKHFDVADSSRLLNRKFIRIVASRLFNNDWADHSSRSRNEMRGNFESDFENIRDNGINVSEFHEIDRIEDNRVYIKAPTTTPLNSNYSVYWKHLQTNIGFEDIHFDGNFQEEYEHNVQSGRNWISVEQVAHSWVQRCRFSNSIVGVFISGYGCSVLSVIQDGRGGHYTAVITGATYCLVGLLEDHTDIGASHGISIAGKSSGNVAWGIGGPIMDGPDTHAGQPRNTLLDNYYSQTHESSSGTYPSLPHHLDGYTRWNNISEETRRLNMWTTNPEYFFITQANMIGYIGGYSPRNAYVESSGSRPVYPNSLYEAQLEHRLGYLPAWIDDSKEMHNEFFGSVFGGSMPPPLEGRSQMVQDAIVDAVPDISNANNVTEEHLSRIKTLHIIYTHTDFKPLKSGDFKGLTAVNDLLIYCISNDGDRPIKRLEELPPGIFSDLRSLHRIRLQKNSFRSISPDIFKGLTSLTEIYLWSNKLESVPSNIFSGLRSLQVVALGHNELTAIPPDLFKGLTKLRAIDFNDNQLTSIPDNLFNGLTSLRRITIHDNEIDPIPITISLEKVEENKVQAIIPTGAPFEVVIPIIVENGSIVKDGQVQETITIKKGKVESTALTVIRSDGLVGNVSVDIGIVPEPPNNNRYEHRGYILNKSDNLPLIVISEGNAPSDIAQIPDQDALLRNFPNPFNPETWIPYQLSKPANVTLTIYNMRGVVVRQLKLGQQPAGVYTNRSRAIHWDGRNEFGEKVAAAVYFYQLQADSVSFLRKMVILK